MAEIKTLGGIASISGKIGNYQFRTMKSTGKVYMHLVPSVQQPTCAADAETAFCRHRQDS